MKRHILASALLLIGCGASETSSGPSGPFGPSPVSGQPVIAQVNLAGEVANARVSLVTEDGALLAQATTNSSGVAFLRPLAVPANFRVVAKMPDSTAEFTAEVQNFGANNRYARVSLLTNLASRYYRSHPGVSLAEAETRIKTAVNVPNGLDLEIGPNEPNPFFSDLAFLRAASENGGLEAFSTRLLGQAEIGQGRFYRFSRDQASRPLSGLDGGLDTVVEQQRLNVGRRLRIPNDPGNPQRYIPSISLIDAPTSLGGQFLLGIGTGLTGNILSAGVSGLLGWGAQQMGLNFGTSGQLKAIADQLNQLTSLVEAMDSQITDDNLKASAQALKSEYSPVRTANTNLSQQEGSTTITNAPFSPPTSFSDLVNSINAPKYADILDDTNNSLVGPGQILMQGQQIVLNQLHGLDRPGSMLSWPWRVNSLLDQVYPLYGYFSGQQTLALNLMAEQSHNFLSFPDPVSGLQQLQPFFRPAVSSLKRQRQQWPLYNSDPNLIVDLENGVMYYAVMQGAETFADAYDYAAQFQMQVAFPDGSYQTYKNWRLPTKHEFESLQNRGHYSPTRDNSVPTTSNNSTPGLPGLGFTNVSTALNSAPNDNGKNGDLWFYYLYKDGSNTYYAPNYEFRLNHTDSSTNLENKSSDKNAFLICRTIGDQPVVDLYTDGSSGIPPGVVGPALTPGECAQYGVPTAISLSTLPGPAEVNYPDPADPTVTDVQKLPVNTIEFVANVTYTVNLGGSFQYGYQDTKGQTNSSVSKSGQVSSHSASNQLRELIDWSSSNSNALNMLNLPYVSGLGIPLQASASTITATILGAGGTPVQGTLNFTPTTLAPHTLTSIQIVPRNQIYGSNNLQPASGAYPYYCTGHYADGTIEPLATNVTWSVSPSPNSANAQIVVNGNGASLELKQPGQSTPVPYNITISASYNGKSDSTLAQIVPPVSN